MDGNPAHVLLIANHNALDINICSCDAEEGSDSDALERLAWINESKSVVLT